MSNPALTDFDFSSENSNKNISPAENILKILTCEKLSTLEDTFKHAEYAGGMVKQEFFKIMKTLTESEENDQLYLDFFDLFQLNNHLTWSSTLHALINAIPSATESQIKLDFVGVHKNELTKRDAIVKILAIETATNFCFTLYSKYGRTGIYDANFKQLAVYHIIMTREDINRKEEDRRRRNRWITDAIYLQDLKKIAVINTARSLVVYDVVGLKHIPVFLVLSLPNVPKCIAYKSTRNVLERHIFIGDDSGSVLVFSFMHSKEVLFRKKHNDKLSLFYWEELNNEKDYVKINTIKDIHKDIIREIIFCQEDNTLITCSKDSSSSVVKMFLDHKKPTMIYEMPRGASTMCFSKKLNLLITGSPDGTIRLWNTLVITKAIGVLKEHTSSIKSILLFEDQKMFVSYCKNGVIKLWSIIDQKCCQTIDSIFSCLKEPGRNIEWAANCMFLGPKEKKTSFSNSRSSSLCENSKNGCNGGNYNGEKSERSIIWVCCYNFLANISLSFQDVMIQKAFEMPKLEPPPKQNNVFVPSTWLLNEESFKELIEKVQCDIEHPERFKDYDYISGNGNLKREERRTTINHRIAQLDKQKREMQENVARGAPFLALKLFDIDDFNVSNNLSVHGKEEKNLMDKSLNLLVQANNKDQVFSELSSSRSRSSRSSVVEFEY